MHILLSVIDHELVFQNNNSIFRSEFQVACFNLRFCEKLPKKVIPGGAFDKMEKLAKYWIIA